VSCLTICSAYVCSYRCAQTNEQSYEVIASDGIRASQLPSHVTLSTPDEVNLPLPSARYIALHAACAQTAHLSGAADYIDEMLDRMEYNGIPVLAEDGSSGDVFDIAWVLAEPRMVAAH
jgi:hypothetical protein